MSLPTDKEVSPRLRRQICKMILIAFCFPLYNMTLSLITDLSFGIHAFYHCKYYESCISPAEKNRPNNIYFTNEVLIIR